MKPAPPYILKIVIASVLSVIMLGCQRVDIGGMSFFENNEFRRTGHFPADLKIFHNLPHNSEIVIHSRVTQLTNQNALLMSALLRDRENNELEGNLYVNNQRIISDAESFYTELNPKTQMGVEALIDFKSTETPGYNFDYQVRIPEKLVVENMPMIIQPGTRIFYKAAEDNYNGLLVLLTFNTGFSSNHRFEGEYENVQNQLWLPLDNGLLEIPESLLRNIPNESVATLTLLRTNIYYFSNSSLKVNNKVIISVRREHNVKIHKP